MAYLMKQQAVHQALNGDKPGPSAFWAFEGMGATTFAATTRAAATLGKPSKPPGKTAPKPKKASAWNTFAKTFGETFASLLGGGASPHTASAAAQQQAQMAMLQQQHRSAQMKKYLVLGAVGIGAALLFMKLRKKPRKNPGRRKWIKGAIKKKGALRATVKRRFGGRGFDSKGRIKKSVLSKLAKEKGKTGQRARLAKTLRRY